MSYQLIIDNSLLGVFHLLVVSIRFVLFFITHQIVNQFPFFGRRTLLYNGPVGFLHLTVAEHIVQTAQCLAGLCKYNQPAYRTIQTVRHPQKYVTGLCILLLNILYHCFRQWYISSLITLHNFGSRFFDYYNMVIFVYYGHNTLK